MIVVVSGGRDFLDEAFFMERMDFLHGMLGFSRVIEGGQRTWGKEFPRKVIGGADFFAYRWALRNNLPVETVVANWDAFGKRAGILRNQEMIDRFSPDVLVAFPTGGPGTADMIQRARRAGLRRYVMRKRP